MKSGDPSSTAETMAMYRAVESMRPEGERIFHDPTALDLLSRSMRRRLKRRVGGAIVRWVMGRFFPGVDGAIAVRSRFIDEALLEHLEDGIEQLVIIGAGYDSRAYRVDRTARQVRVFEVDHPVTQETKLERLRAFLPREPEHVAFVPVRVGIDDLGPSLIAAGYDRAKRSLFIMEGLLMYLPVEVVDGLLRFISANAPPGSAVVFDYLPPSMVDGSVQEKEGKAMRKNVIKNGEPFHFGMAAEEMTRYLTERGYDVARNVAAPACGVEHTQALKVERKISALFTLVSATVAPR